MEKEGKKMRTSIEKKKTASIALILMLTFSATILTLPIVSGHDPPWEVPTWCYSSIAAPNPIGVNQQVVVIFWINAIPPTAHGAAGDRWKFNLRITTPGGSEDIVGPITSDPVGGGWALYTPTEVGTYTIVAEFLEHTITGLPLRPDGTINSPDSVGDIYLGSTAKPLELIVQEDPANPWPETPVTDDYWERPINAMNRDWYVLAGNWLGGLSMQTNGPTRRFGWGKGTESAHILWATPMWAGGIMDQRFSVTGYQTGHYEGLYFSPPIILDGKIYYNIYSLPMEGWRVLDLYTGEELWFHNTTGPVSDIGGPMDGLGIQTVESHTKRMVKSRMEGNDENRYAAQNGLVLHLSQAGHVAVFLQRYLVGQDSDHHQRGKYEHPPQYSAHRPIAYEGQEEKSN